MKEFLWSDSPLARPTAAACLCLACSCSCCRSRAARRPPCSVGRPQTQGWLQPCWQWMWSCWTVIELLRSYNCHELARPAWMFVVQGMASCHQEPPKLCPSCTLSPPPRSPPQAGGAAARHPPPQRAAVHRRLLCVARGRGGGCGPNRGAAGCRGRARAGGGGAAGD